MDCDKCTYEQMCIREYDQGCETNAVLFRPLPCGQRVDNASVFGHGHGVQRTVRRPRSDRGTVRKVGRLGKQIVEKAGRDMESITVVCDRCKKSVAGFEDLGVGTSGFYRRLPERLGRGAWDKYMDEGENIVCDACMCHDERYQRDYWPVK